MTNIAMRSRFTEVSSFFNRSAAWHNAPISVAQDMAQALHTDA